MSTADQHDAQSTTGTAHLRFAPETLAHLGERLVPGAEQAIIELVKNAYDADAKSCIVNIDPDSSRLSIRDDGVGMTGADLRDGWLVLGKSGKSSRAKTPKFNRNTVGDKGLGRLAALRLGNSATIHTRPAAEPGREYRLRLDWAIFSAAATVEEVDLIIEEHPTTLSHGTDIFVDDLRVRFTRNDVAKVGRGLILLSDPFQGDSGFSARLEAAAFADIERRVHDSYFGDADYRIEATIDSEGDATCTLLDWKGDALVPLEVLTKGPYATVPATFQLWVFPLGGGAFSTRKARPSEIRPWLAVVGGVHVYEGPIRVPPYGDEGVDWLEMNLRRVRSPEGRPSTNNSVGRVIVDNSSGRLEQKTDRVGYIETDAFAELVRFGKDALDWGAHHVLKQMESRRQRQRAQVKEHAAEVEKKIDAVAKTMPEREQQVFREAVNQVVTVSEKRVRALEEDLQLYRSLATAGMTSAVFSHEIGKPLGMVTRSLDLIEEQIPDGQKKSAKGIFDLVRAAAERLNAYVDLPMSLLKKEKRRVGQTDLLSSVRGVFKLFDPIIEGAEIIARVDLPAARVSINGSIALLDGIFANFIANTITAFQRDGISPEQRHIWLTVAPDERPGFVSIVFSDNAGGLIDISENEIWTPGATTREDGTGFGLTIVRDSVHDLGGTIHVVALSDAGGAQFTIALPVSELAWD